MRNKKNLMEGVTRPSAVFLFYLSFLMNTYHSHGWCGLEFEEYAVSDGTLIVNDYNQLIKTKSCILPSKVFIPIGHFKNFRFQSGYYIETISFDFFNFCSVFKIRKNILMPSYCL